MVTIIIGSRIKNFQRGKDKEDNINKNLKEQFIKVPIRIINNGDKKSIIGDKKIWRKTVEAQKENGKRDKGAHTEKSNLIEMIILREAKALIGKIMAKRIIGTQVMNKEKSTEATSRDKTRRSEGLQKKDLNKIRIRQEMTNVRKDHTDSKAERDHTDNKTERGHTGKKTERGHTGNKTERGRSNSKAEKDHTDNKMERGHTDKKTGKETIDQITKWKSSILK